MVIERDDDTIIIKLDAKLLSLDDVQEYSGYLRVLESNAQNKGTVEQATALAEAVDKKWWSENKHRFIK